jgi:high-affinity K+ transport system ATPase subunit B
MTTKEEYLLHTWPKQQAKGKVIYVTYYALFYALIVSVISFLIQNSDLSAMEMLLSTEFLIKLALFATIGAVMASFKWKANNKKYEELKRQSEQEAGSQL